MKKSLEPIAQLMLDHPDLTARLVGTTAGGEYNDYTKTLSNNRANAVKTTLVSLGVPEQRIQTDAASEMAQKILNERRR